MSDTEIVKEVVNRLEQYEIDIPTADTTIPQVNCESPEHNTQRNALREGNWVVIIAVKEDDTWKITQTACSSCSIRSLYDREQGDNQITAVIEGQLQETPSHVEHTDVRLVSPNVWELNTPRC